MKCRKVKKRLVDYIENELKDFEKKAIDDHLKICNKCSAELNGLKETIDLTKRVRVPRLSERFWVNFLPHVREKIETREDRRFSFRLVPVFAVSLSILFIIGIFYLRNREPNIETVEVTESAIIETLVNEDIAENALEMETILEEEEIENKDIYVLIDEMEEEERIAFCKRLEKILKRG